MLQDANVELCDANEDDLAHVRESGRPGRNGLSYLTQHTVKYIPIGDKIELNLGVDPNVILELIKLRASRDEIWMQVHGADVFRRVGGGIQVEVNSSVVGWDDHEVYTQRVRNYTAKPIEVEIRRSFPGHVIFRSQLKPTLHDFQTPQFTATVDAGKKADLLFEVVRHQGRNAKQNNVTVEEAQVAPLETAYLLPGLPASPGRITTR